MNEELGCSIYTYHNEMARNSETEYHFSGRRKEYRFFAYFWPSNLATCPPNWLIHNENTQVRVRYNAAGSEVKSISYDPKTLTCNEGGTLEVTAPDLYTTVDIEEDEFTTNLTLHKDWDIATAKATWDDYSEGALTFPLIDVRNGLYYFAVGKDVRAGGRYDTDPISGVVTDDSGQCNYVYTRGDPASVSGSLHILNFTIQLGEGPSTGVWLDTKHGASEWIYSGIWSGNTQYIGVFDQSYFEEHVFDVS